MEKMASGYYPGSYEKTENGHSALRNYVNIH
jgi:hypothetical protein